MTWTLEDKPTEILVKGELLSFKPGDGYPGGYSGSKYSIRRVGNKYAFSVKSYSGNFVEAKQLPKGLIPAINLHKSGFSGSIRIRWNGDTILAPQKGEPPIYIGKMSYGEGAGKIFQGLDLNQSSSNFSIFAGPQSAMDIGEPWSVPARGHIRPKLTRRFRVDGNRERINTATEHLDLTDLVINRLDGWDGKRLYFTNFGQIVSPVTITQFKMNNMDLKDEVEKLRNQNLDNAVRFSVDRIERTFRSYGRPWVMMLVGNVSDFTGPEPDLIDGPEYDLSDEGVKGEEGI